MVEWYWMKDGQKHGPVDTADLKQLARTGQLQPTDTIWREGLPNWVSASKAKGLYPEPTDMSDLEEFPVMSGHRTGDDVSAPPLLQTPAKVQRYTCSICSGMFLYEDVYDDYGTIVCKRCFSDRSASSCRNAVVPSRREASSDGGLIVAGYVCAVVALLFFPPAFGIAGLVIGIVNLSRGSTGHGIAQIVLSVTCAIFGMMIGAAMWN